jgi:hypothetical protein
MIALRTNELEMLISMRCCIVLVRTHKTNARSLDLKQGTIRDHKPCPVWYEEWR